MVVDGDGQLLFGFVLADHVAVEKSFDFRRTRQAFIDGIGLLALLFFKNLLADSHTLVADVSARVVRGRADQFLDLLLRFMAEGTAQWFVSAEFSQRCVAFRRSRPSTG